MNTHNRRQYGSPRLSQQQRDDMLMELMKRMDGVWTHWFDKTGGSSEHEADVDEENDLHRQTPLIGDTRTHP